MESDPCRALVSHLRTSLTGYLVFRHEDRAASGIPDISVTGFGKTSWWEVKLADPTFDQTGLKHYRMCQLAGAGLAYYIIFEEHTTREATFIVRPQLLSQWRNGEYWPGFDYAAVEQFMRRLHQPK